MIIIMIMNIVEGYQVYNIVWEVYSMNRVVKHRKYDIFTIKIKQPTTYPQHFLFTIITNKVDIHINIGSINTKKNFHFHII